MKSFKRKQGGINQSEKLLNLKTPKEAYNKEIKARIPKKRK